MRGLGAGGIMKRRRIIYEKICMHMKYVLKEKLKMVKEENLSPRRARERIKGVLNGGDIEREGKVSLTGCDLVERRKI